MNTKKRKGYFESEEGIAIRHKFELMISDNLYNTASSYSTNSELYPDNLIPFVDKHMNYLNEHPSLESSKYIANIKLMARKR
jgi:hypothetical protein